MAQVIETPADNYGQKRARMELAKAKFTAAARAALSGDPDAPRLSLEAIHELTEARAALAQTKGDQ